LKPDPELGVRLAYALWRFWQQRGYLNEARAGFDRLEAQGWTLEPIDRAHFAEAYGGVAYWQSDAETARRLYDEQLRAWRELGDKREIANALYNRAYADMIDVMQGDVEAAQNGRQAPLLDEALAIYRELGDVGGEANILWALGSVYFFTANAGVAEEWYRQALELHRKAGNRSMEAWSLHMLGLSRAGPPRFEAADEVVRHAMRHFYEAGDVSGVTLVLDDLAIIAVGREDPARGGRLWGAARHLQQRTGTALADYVEQTNALFGVPTPKDALPSEELAALSADGAAMSYDEIVAYALEVPAGSLPPSHAEVTS
jgi:tetratricopeptide (TPR) repeat protein